MRGSFRRRAMQLKHSMEEYLEMLNNVAFLGEQNHVRQENITKSARVLIEWIDSGKFTFCDTQREHVNRVMLDIAE